MWNEENLAENLADSFPTEKEETTIKLLIGNDYYLDFIIPQRVEVQPGLYMLTSKLGWILTGRTTETAEDTPEYNMLIMTHSTNTMIERNKSTDARQVISNKAQLEDFWRLDLIRI